MRLAAIAVLVIWGLALLEIWGGENFWSRMVEAARKRAKEWGRE